MSSSLPILIGKNNLINYSNVKQFKFIFNDILVLLTVSLPIKCVAPVDRYHVAFSVGQSEFSKSLYDVLSEKNGNLLFSPISIHVNLALLTLATKGPARYVLENILGIPNDVARYAYHDKVHQLERTSKKLNMSMANMIFHKNNMKLNGRFKFYARKYFNTLFIGVNFQDKIMTKELINEVIPWHMKRPHLIDLFEDDEIPTSSDIFVTTVVTLHGKWEKKFQIRNTKFRPFHYCGRNYIKTHMMNIKEQFKYKFVDKIDSHVLFLPLKADVNFVLILPRSCKGIKRLEKDILYYDLTSIYDNLRLVNVDLWLPRLSISNSHNMSDTLRKVSLILYLLINMKNLRIILKNYYYLKILRSVSINCSMNRA